MNSASTNNYGAFTPAVNPGVILFPKIKRIIRVPKEMKSFSVDSATLGMSYTTGNTGNIIIEVSDVPDKMTLTTIDPIDAAIAAMSDEEITAVVDALFGSWVGKSEFTEASRDEMWGGWAEKLASLHDDESKTNTI